MANSMLNAYLQVAETQDLTPAEFIGRRYPNAPFQFQETLYLLENELDLAIMVGRVETVLRCGADAVYRILED